jgi:hypothetical protein
VLVLATATAGGCDGQRRRSDLGGAPTPASAGGGSGGNRGATGGTAGSTPSPKPISLAAGINYPVTAVPVSVAVGDLNGDGQLDLAVANTDSTSGLSVLLNLGGGVFSPSVDYAAGPSPQSVAMGDVDGDGRADLVVANRDSGEVSVLANHGDGTFAPRVAYPSGAGPQAVVLGDVTGDGKGDLLVSNAGGGAAGSGDVSLLVNRGDGTFGAAVHLAVGMSPQAIALGDVDGDLDLDLVVANRDSADVSILLNRGDGSFGAAAVYPTVGHPSAVVLTDLDGDLRLEPSHRASLRFAVGTSPPGASRRRPS